MSVTTSSTYTPSISTIGPLTTTFTPDSSCFAPKLNAARGGKVEYGLECSEFMYNTHGVASTCYPSGDQLLLLDSEWPVHDVGVFSPGYACPSAFTEACKRTGSFGDTVLSDGQAAIGCCPVGYSCYGSLPTKCVDVQTTGFMGYAIFSLDDDSSSCATISTAYEVSSPITIWATAVILIRDEPTTTSADADLYTTPAETPTPTIDIFTSAVPSSSDFAQYSVASDDSSSISSGARLTLEILLPIIVLAKIILLLFYCGKRQGRREAAAAKRNNSSEEGSVGEPLTAKPELEGSTVRVFAQKLELDAANERVVVATIAELSDGTRARETEYIEMDGHSPNDTMPHDSLMHPSTNSTGYGRRPTAQGDQPNVSCAVQAETFSKDPWRWADPLH